MASTVSYICDVCEQKASPAYSVTFAAKPGDNGPYWHGDVCSHDCAAIWLAGCKPAFDRLRATQEVA